jgi:uncharacterized membrane protein YbhN (UPF0104 family)
LVRNFLRFGVSAGLLAWLAFRIDWGQVGHTFAHLHLGLWLAAVALYVANQVLSGLRWQWLARPLGFRQPLRQFLAFYFIGMFFNLILPTSVGGDVVRAWYLDGSSGRRIRSFLSVLVDRISGLLVLLTLACVAVAVCPIDLPDWVPTSVWATAGCAAAGLVLLLLLRRWTGGVARLRAILDSLDFYLRQPRLLLSSTIFSLGVQAGVVGVVWLAGRSMDAHVPGAYYWIVVPMVSLLTMVPLSVNGVGLREWGMVLFLTPLGVTEGAALSLSFLWFSVVTASSLVGGLVYLAGCFPRPKGQGRHEPVSDHPGQGRVRQYPAPAWPALPGARATRAVS